MKLLRNSLVWLLLASLTAVSVSRTFYFERSIRKHRRMVKIELAQSSENCTTLFFTSKDWSKRKRIGADEFELNNKRYDVVEVKKVEGGVNVLCFKDEKEGELLASWKTEQQNQQEGKRVQLPFTDWCADFVNHILILPEVVALYTNANNHPLITSYPYTFSPPPEV